MPKSLYLKADTITGAHPDPIQVTDLLKMLAVKRSLQRKERKSCLKKSRNQLTRLQRCGQGSKLEVPTYGASSIVYETEALASVAETPLYAPGGDQGGSRAQSGKDITCHCQLA